MTYEPVITVLLLVTPPVSERGLKTKIKRLSKGVDDTPGSAAFPYLRAERSDNGFKGAKQTNDIYLQANDCLPCLPRFSGTGKADKHDTERPITAISHSSSPAEREIRPVSLCRGRRKLEETAEEMVRV